MIRSYERTRPGLIGPEWHVEADALDVAALRVHAEDVGNDGWTGVSASGAKLEELRSTWKNGVKKLEEMPGFWIPPMGRQKLSDWNQGDDWSLLKLREGRAPWTRRAKRLAPQKTLRINIGENSGVSAEKMIYKAYAATRIADQYEGLGVPVEIILENYTYNLSRKYANPVQTTIRLKHFEDPVNLGFIATCTSPWFLRQFIFSLWRANVPHVDSNGLGSARQLFVSKNSQDVDPNEILIDKGACLDMEAVEEFISSLEEEEGAHV